MRYLSDGELPQQELERREVIRESIRRLMDQAEDTWKHVEPAILDALASRDYDRESTLKSRAHEQLDRLRRKVKELQALLPPYVEMAEGDLLYADGRHRPIDLGQSRPADFPNKEARWVRR
jgi:hypothetical protein